MCDTFADGTNNGASVVVTANFTASSSPALSVHTLFVLPDDPSSVPELMAPALDRAANASGHPAVLVLARDADAAVAIATALGRPDVLAATSVNRAARVTPPAIVIGPSDVILGLIARSKLKLEHVVALVLAWVDASPALEAILADVPKDIVRTIVAQSTTPAVEALVERYARRPRRVGGAAAPATATSDMRFVPVTPGNRPQALRRLLDDLDPPSAIVYTRTDSSEHTVREILGALGYAGAHALVQVARGAIPESAALVVLYDLPLDAKALGDIVQSGPVQIVALGRMPGAKPLVLSGPLERAKRRVEELRRVLEAGVPAAELTWLEPLLDAYDGIEIAAAAVHLLERERRPIEQPQTTNPRRPGTPGAHRSSGRR
jgi:hypothetical protein